MPATTPIKNQKSTIGNQPPTSSTKPRRLEEIATSKAGLFALDPAILSIEPGFNRRHHWGDLDALAADIEANGLDQPLKIRKVKGEETIFIVAGHRRHRAITTILIPQGRWQDPENPKANLPVYCYSEAQGTSPLDRLFSQIAGNTGLSYTLLEKARVYQDILATDPTIIPAELARRSGETKQAVSDALRLVNDAIPQLIAAVEEETLAASTAIHIIKQAATPQEQAELLAAALTNARESNRSHVTPKDIPAAPPKEPSSSSNQKSPILNPQSSIPDSPSSSPTPQSSIPSFTLYEIPDAPSEPTAEGFFHETSRLVLTHLPEGIDLLHLLSALDEAGEPCYGYRFNEVTCLPDPDVDSSYGTGAEEGLTDTLRRIARFVSVLADPFILYPIQDALFDALCRYFPEQGLPEVPETLAFVATPDAPAKPATGYQGILNSPSIDRSGGSGPGSGGFVSPENALKSIERIMDELDASGKGHEHRITTAEIVLRVLRNEATPGSLKNHLMGK